MSYNRTYKICKMKILASFQFYFCSFALCNLYCNIVWRKYIMYASNILFTNIIQEKRKPFKLCCLWRWSSPTLFGDDWVWNYVVNVLTFKICLHSIYGWGMRENNIESTFFFSLTFNFSLYLEHELCLLLGK